MKVTDEMLQKATNAVAYLDRTCGPDSNGRLRYTPKDYARAALESALGDVEKPDWLPVQFVEGGAMATISDAEPLPEWVQYMDVQLMEPGRWGACLYDVPEDKATALDCRIDGYGETYAEALDNAVSDAIAFGREGDA